MRNMETHTRYRYGQKSLTRAGRWPLPAPTASRLRSRPLSLRSPHFARPERLRNPPWPKAWSCWRASGCASANGPAAELLKEAVTIRAAAAPQSWELAHARGLLGQALIAGGQVAEGRIVLQQALAVLAPQLGSDHPETVQVRRALAQ